MVKMCLAQDPAADALLDSDPLALLTGMLLDQQVPMEKAFRGPYDIRQRLGHDLDAGEIAAMDPERLTELFSARPAIHRFPGAMAKRTQAMCALLTEKYDGDAEAVWRDAASGADALKRLAELPGFGKQKAHFCIRRAERFDQLYVRDSINNLRLMAGLCEISTVNTFPAWPAVPASPFVPSVAKATRR